MSATARSITKARPRHGPVPPPGLPGAGAHGERPRIGGGGTIAAAGGRLLCGRMLTGRDAAHKRMVDLIAKGEPLPVDLRDSAIDHVGPVDAVRDGWPAPPASTRMDGFTDKVLEATGLLVMIGKAERGPAAIDSIARHGAASLIAVGAAAYLMSNAMKQARVLASMPVTVAVDATGALVHQAGPSHLRRPVVRRVFAAAGA